jgi:hypothetical protein
MAPTVQGWLGQNCSFLRISSHNLRVPQETLDELLKLVRDNYDEGLRISERVPISKGSKRIGLGTISLSIPEYGILGKQISVFFDATKLSGRKGSAAVTDDKSAVLRITVGRFFNLEQALLTATHELSHLCDPKIWKGITTPVSPYSDSYSKSLVEFDAMSKALSSFAASHPEKHAEFMEWMRGTGPFPVPERNLWVEEWAKYPSLIKVFKQRLYHEIMESKKRQELPADGL